MSDIREDKNNVFTQDQTTQQREVVPNAPNVKPDPNNWVKELGLEIPVETVPLPSTGKVYPVSSTLHNRETVEIKSMTAKEEDILTSKALIKNGTVITKLLQSCLVDKSINVSNMLSGDRNAIMVGVRITGYGSSYKTSVSCPTCSEIQEHDFQLSQMPLKTLDIDPVSAGTNEFSVLLPKTKATVHFKFLTGKDEEEITMTSNRKKKAKILSDSLVTTRLQHSILSVNGRTDRTLISKFATNMPAIDSLFLREYIDKNEPGIDMSAEIVCSNPDCGELSEVSVPLGVSFFWPNAKS